MIDNEIALTKRIVKIMAVRDTLLRWNREKQDELTRLRAENERLKSALGEKMVEIGMTDAGEGWISVEERLPSSTNGYVDETVLIAVKNKNKEDGIFLLDVSNFDGEKWGARYSTWEEILYWMPLPDKPGKGE